jgi:hypothetical protein
MWSTYNDRCAGARAWAVFSRISRTSVGAEEAAGR